jgi:hypothetical protein
MTLQEQYNLIKEGKGHKGVFLTEAKKLFPNMLTNPMGFDEATKILKTRGVLSEGYVDLKPINTFEASPKTSWENKFAQFLAEEAKKPEKEVEEIQSHNFDYKDKSNLNNQIGQEVLNGIYFEAKENPDKSLDEIRKIVEKNLAKDGQHYMKNAAFGVKGLGYQETEVQEVSGKHKSSGYSDKLKKMVKESLVKEEYTQSDLERDKEISKKNSAKAQKGLDQSLLNFLTNVYKNKANIPADIKQKMQDLENAIKAYDVEDLNEESFEDKMAQLRALKDKQRMGQAPDTKVDNKKQRLQQKLNMLKRAYMDLISDMEKETDLNFAASEDWYQEQLDDLENSIGDIESKINGINEGKSSKPSLDSDLAEIDTQADIVAMEAKLDKISEMISTKMERLGMIEEDTNLAELVDKGKMKAMQKEIKILEKRKAKMEKVYEKMAGKAYTKEMVDEVEVEEGIHDKDITSASHTNIKIPPKGVGDYDPAKSAASLKRLANMGPKKQS